MRLVEFDKHLDADPHQRPHCEQHPDPPKPECEPALPGLLAQLVCISRLEVCQGVQQARHGAVLDSPKGDEDSWEDPRCSLVRARGEVVRGEEAEVKRAPSHEPAVSLEDDEDVAALEGLPRPKPGDVPPGEHVGTNARCRCADEGPSEERDSAGGVAVNLGMISFGVWARVRYRVRFAGLCKVETEIRHGGQACRSSCWLEQWRGVNPLHQLQKALIAF